MNTLHSKLTAIGLAGAVGLGAFAIPSVPASAAPVAPSQNTVKQSAPSQTEDVRWRRRHHVGPAIALGAFAAVAGAIAADRYYRRHYYYGPYYPAYYHRPYYYGPRYYYGPPRYYYGW